MRLLFLFGAQAVGKMTVGQALEALTTMRLFHNHMTIEPVIRLFGEYNGRIVDRLRQVIFEEFAQSSQYGMIFTYVWAFDQPTDWADAARIAGIFEAAGAEVDYCELIAPQDVRLARNRTENRQREKPSKRNADFAEQLILQTEKKYRCVSEIGEIPFPRYLRLDNSELTPEEAARRIAAHFGYPQKSN